MKGYGFLKAMSLQQIEQWKEEMNKHLSKVGISEKEVRKIWKNKNAIVLEKERREKHGTRR